MWVKGAGKISHASFVVSLVLVPDTYGQNVLVSVNVVKSFLRNIWLESNGGWISPRSPPKLAGSQLARLLPVPGVENFKLAVVKWESPWWIQRSDFLKIEVVTLGALSAYLLIWNRTLLSTSLSITRLG